MWRGGRPLKSPTTSNLQQHRPQVNGSGKNKGSITISDSEEEEELPIEQAQFEDEAEEFDPEAPYSNIIRSIDVSLGTRVLHISVPATTSFAPHKSPESSPSLLAQKLVVAVACGDCTVRAITLPLTPPASAETRFQEEVTTLSGQEDISNCLSITFTSVMDQRDSNEVEEATDDKQIHRQTRSQTQQQGSRKASSGSRPRKSDQWDLLLATHSPAASGLLTVYRLRVRGDTLSKTLDAPIQRRYLSSPATALRFNSALYPSQRHSLLLVQDSKGLVRLYSCVSPTKRRPSRSRSSSTYTQDASAPEGQWLLTLYPPFEMSSLTTPGRKEVLDSQWVLGGRAVMVLLADGQWGVWDIEGVGPGVEQSLMRGSSVPIAITGGGLTPFALSGHLSAGGSAGTGRAISAPKARSEPNSKLAPMTPATRRVQEKRLFDGPPASANLVKTNTRQGKIVVLQKSGSLQDPSSDETIVFWHGDTLSTIPSLLSYWRNRSSGTLENSLRHRIVPIERPRLFGQRQLDVDVLPQSFNAVDGSPDLLVLAEHKLIILTEKLKEQEQISDLVIQQNGDDVTMLEAGSDTEIDQRLLSEGKLGIEGVDRMLDGISSPKRRPTLRERLRIQKEQREARNEQRRAAARA